jgi:hypothetical protein
MGVVLSLISCHDGTGFIEGLVSRHLISGRDNALGVRPLQPIEVPDLFQTFVLKSVPRNVYQLDAQQKRLELVASVNPVLQ